jgi:hypothetical protein
MIKLLGGDKYNMWLAVNIIIICIKHLIEQIQLLGEGCSLQNLPSISGTSAVVLGTMVTLLCGKWDYTPCEKLDHSVHFLAPCRILTSNKEWGLCYVSRVVNLNWHHYFASYTCPSILLYCVLQIDITIIHCQHTTSVTTDVSCVQLENMIADFK